MKKTVFTLTSAMVLALGATAFADELEFPTLDMDNLAVSAGLSIFGYTITPSYRINDTFGIRIPMGYATAPTDVVKDGTQVKSKILGGTIYTDIPAQHEKVNVDAIMGGFGLLVDYYPNLPKLGSPFRTSYGLMFPQYKLDGYGVVDDFINANGQQIKVHDIDVEMTIPSISPYAGLGYDYKIRDNWGVSLDIGVLYNVLYEGKISGTASDPADQARLDEALQAEMDRKEQELVPYPFLPYFQAGVTYWF